MTTFVAIDFETANHSRNSACAVGIAVGRAGRIVDTGHFLIQPPSRDFAFTYIHGIEWRDVESAPRFAELWPKLTQYFSQADFLVAHNAPFDRSVLQACCEQYGLSNTSVPFECTVQIARRFLGYSPAKLPDVCRRLNIPLQHHDAGSDAEACARIVLAASKLGWRGKANRA